jgi:lipid-A-disaccharide synthase
VLKRLIRVRWLGLPNLILNEGRIPEFIQNDATPEKIGDEAVRLLSEKGRLEAQKRDLEEVSRRLGGGGANRRAALEILSILGQ